MCLTTAIGGVSRQLTNLGQKTVLLIMMEMHDDDDDDDDKR